jgi:hypothetical protein
MQNFPNQKSQTDARARHGKAKPNRGDFAPDLTIAASRLPYEQGSLKTGDRVMMQRYLFAVVAVLSVGISSGALPDGHAITPDGSVPYASDDPQPYETAMVGTREVCTTRRLVAGARTECRYEPLPTERPSSLKGICITAYGSRACY